MTDSANPTRDDLEARAAELNVEGRSSMKKAELEAAIAEAEAAAAAGASTAQPGPPAPAGAGPDAGGEPTLETLREQAAELNVEGRSSMDKAELLEAVRNAQAIASGHLPAGAPTPSPEPTGADVSDVLAAHDQPSSPDVVGRPSLSEVAELRSANRTPRVIGAAPQED